MKGKSLYYLLFGFIGFLITFAVSSSSNLFVTSLIRGLTAFAIWVVLLFLLNWVISFLKEMPDDMTLEQIEASHIAQSDESKGTNLDLTTPDESEEISEMLKQPLTGTEANDEGFAPLKPPKLVKTTDDNDKDAAELADIVRHLTEQ